MLGGVSTEASVTVIAVVMVTYYPSIVLCHTFPLPLAARMPRDAPRWHTNSLRETWNRDREKGREDTVAAEVINPQEYFKDDVNYPTEREGLETRIDHGDPEEIPGFFQGDMMGVHNNLLPMTPRVGLNWDIFPERRWTNATVPYVISDLYGSSEKKMILLAMHTLNFLSCIKFVPWDKVTPDYLLIWPMKWPKGCWSYVGRKGGKQILSLEPPNSLSKRCFVSLGKPIHELLHTLGMFHEQSRPDRDKFINVITDNIIPKFIRNFNKQSADNTTIPFKYDYDSVMHYGDSFFSLIRNRPTIVPKVNGTNIGQRIMISKLDCLKLNDLYGCMDNPFDQEKYTAFCKYLGY